MRLKPSMGSEANTADRIDRTWHVLGITQTYRAKNHRVSSTFEEGIPTIRLLLIAHSSVHLIFTRQKCQVGDTPDTA